MTDAAYQTDFLAMSQISNEQAVIASVLADSTVLRFAVDEVSGDDFADLRLGIIFEGMVDMFAKREAIDWLTVFGHFREWNIRGISQEDLGGWMIDVPSATHISFYAAHVREEARRRALGAIGVGLQQEAATREPSWALSHALERLVALRDSDRVEVLRAKTLGEVLEGEDEYDWVIDGLLERRDRLILTGSEGAGKTTFSRQLAILAAAGLHPIQFTPIKPARVLVVDAENSEKQWRRAARPMVMRAALHGQVNPAETMHLHCAAMLDLTQDKSLALIHKLVDEHHPDILFIGPLYKLIGAKSIDKDSDAAPLLSALDSLRERGCALLIEAHAGHTTNIARERDMRPRGSSALMGWPEFGLGLRVAKDGRSSNDFQLVRWRGDRDSRAWPSRISRGGDTTWPWIPTVWN